MRTPAYPSIAPLGSRRSHTPIQQSHAPIQSGRAPSFDRTVPRSPRRAGSGQVLPRHTRGSPYRCSLPGLAGFDDSRCVGPNLQHRSTRLIQHDPPSRGDSTPLKRIAGYRAPLTPRLARPRRRQSVAEGAGFEPAAQGLPVHGISSAAPSAARSPLRVHFANVVAVRAEHLAEGRGFEPPRDLLGPYPISSRTPSTGLGHPSANRYLRLSKNPVTSAAHSVAR